MHVFTATSDSIVLSCNLTQQVVAIKFLHLSGRIRQQSHHLPTPELQEGRKSLIRIPCPFLPTSRSTRLLTDTFYLRGHPYYHTLTSPINPVPYIMNFRGKNCTSVSGYTIVNTFHVAVQFFSTSPTRGYTNSSQHLSRYCTQFPTYATWRYTISAQHLPRESTQTGLTSATWRYTISTQHLPPESTQTGPNICHVAVHYHWSTSST
jgi:hypothetical protein